MVSKLSEFSYGYAVTESFAYTSGFSLNSAPIFPSLIDEGKPHHGYDVEIPLPAVPIFLQFKLSQLMFRSNAYEYSKNPVVTLPYFRFFLRTQASFGEGSQHYMLFKLSSLGNLVYYTAPAFHRIEEFNRLYVNRQILSNSVFIEPYPMGRLDDNQKHSVVFHKNIPNQYWLFSDPGTLMKDITLEAFVKKVKGQWEEKKFITESLESVKSLESQLIDIIQEASPYNYKSLPGPELLKEQKNTQLILKRISFFAMLYFDCQFLLMRPT